ncbi:hypothetical protein M011DRAFT_465919 [Sporormia fimetaria CBS 119925]|uniref:Uncharacterized protein n=1 Tax=Sporormia fimetaria CBS 119925 TaxID=1340428 RepID=A0A6A6VID7_9PLEO|nr:hypothetical protein M011DRAFT_465919 [Sporormia fimetaria CBS 119925]
MCVLDKQSVQFPPCDTCVHTPTAKPATRVPSKVRHTDKPCSAERKIHQGHEAAASIGKLLKK